MLNINFFLLFIIINLILLIFYKKISKYINVYDNPDKERKYHKNKTPLIGGVFLFINLLIFLIFQYLNDIQIYPNIEFYIFTSCFFLLGYYDDKFHLNANTKLILSLLIVSGLMYLDYNLVLTHLYLSFNYNNYPLFYFSYPVTILCILLFVNALNMFDGMNLQSGTYSLIIFIILLSSNVFNLLSVVMIIGILFFLIINFNGRIFFGDSGTLMLGSIISYIFISDYNTVRNFSVEEIFLIMYLPGLDLLRVAMYRIINKRHPFSPDRQHIHHYLLNKYSSRISLTVLMILSFFPYFLNRIFEKPYTIIISTILVYILLVYILSRVKNDLLKDG